MFWKRRSSNTVSSEEACARALFHALANGLRKDGRIRAEGIISAAASITGELCIAAAGNFNPREHEFVPGQRIFSDRVNELFSGDSADEGLEAVPSDSIVGMLSDKLLQNGYNAGDFPSLKAVFEDFAGNIGKASDWGEVPLSVPDANRPFILPLQVAYETRSTVDRLFQPLTTPEQKLRAGVFTLAGTMIAVHQVIDKKTAIRLALETVNGMAKTAPMTDRAIASAKNKNETP